MICAGKGARVITNIWNNSLDKRNILRMLREKQSKRVGMKDRGRKKEKK